MDWGSPPFLESLKTWQLRPRSSLLRELPLVLRAVKTRLQKNCDMQDAFVELYGPSMRPLFDFSWLSLKALLSLALVGACITLGAYLGHK